MQEWEPGAGKGRLPLRKTSVYFAGVSLSAKTHKQQGGRARAEQPADTFQNDPVIGAYAVHLPMFEGPLDLLLHLCQKHELNILEIPISFVTGKYLEYLAVMQLMDLDIASEYLLMAATLAHIKSRSLLPAPPPGQDDEARLEDEMDPREALIRRLLEYQKYKDAGAQLAARGIAGQDVFFRGAQVEEALHTGVAPLAEVALFSLVEAFQHVLAKSRVKLSHEVVAERISITDRIHELTDALKVRPRLLFEELFSGLTTKFDLVITFLACLEMTRLKMTRLYQTDALGPLYVELSAAPTSEKSEVLAPASGSLEGATHDDR
jgi:segregation and condensation protein A